MYKSNVGNSKSNNGKHSPPKGLSVILLDYGSALRGRAHNQVGMVAKCGGSNKTMSAIMTLGLRGKIAIRLLLDLLLWNGSTTWREDRVVMDPLFRSIAHVEGHVDSTFLLLSEAFVLCMLDIRRNRAP